MENNALKIGEKIDNGLNVALNEACFVLYEKADVHNANVDYVAFI